MVATELELARIEVAANVGRLVRNIVVAGVGLLLLGLAIVFLLAAAVVALASAIGLLWSLVAIGGSAALAGVVALGGGASGIRRARLLPRRAMARLGRDIEELTEAGKDEARGTS